MFLFHIREFGKQLSEAVNKKVSNDLYYWVILLISYLHTITKLLLDIVRLISNKKTPVYCTEHGHKRSFLQRISSIEMDAIETRAQHSNFIQ